MQNKHYVSHGVSEVYDLPKEKRSTSAELNVYLVTTFSFIVREPKAPESIQKDADTMQTPCRYHADTMQTPCKRTCKFSN